MSNAIEAHNLSRKFGRNVAVAGLDLQVPQGTIFACLGPNGAGKTTLIKTLMNIMPPSSGTARVLGTDSQSLGPREFQQIGYVSENQETLDWMSVAELFAYCRPLYPTWDDDFCRELARQFEVPLQERVANLSR